MSEQGSPMQPLQPSLAICRTSPACNRLAGWALLTAVCGVFHAIVILLALALWPLLSSSAAWYTRYLPGLVVVLVLIPHHPWQRVNRLFELWYPLFSMAANPPQVVKGQRYLFAIAPHGVFPFWSWGYSAYLARVLEQEDPVGGGVASILLRLPILRTLCLWTSCIPASRASLRAGLERNSQQLVVDGIAGIFETADNWRASRLQHTVSRKGFCKLALETGTDVVPVFVFGSTDAFKLVRLPAALTWFSRKLRVSLALFHGRWGLPLPFGVRFTFAHGDTIKVSRVDKPTQAQIDTLHAHYVRELHKAFEDYKEYAGYGGQQLTLITE